MKHEFPSDWRLSSLSELIGSIMGGVSRPANDRRAAPGERGILTLSAVSSGRFLPTKNKAVGSSNGDALGPTVRADTVLISRSNTSELVGACVHVDVDYPWLHLPDLIWQLQVSDPTRYSARWLNDLLSSPLVRTEIESRAVGTSGSMKKLSMASLRNIRVPVPPLNEQSAISSALACWAQAINLIEDLLDQKARFRDALMQQLPTGKRRFREFVRLRGVHHTPCGELPHDWPLAPLRKVFRVVKRRNGTATARVLTASGQDGMVDQRDFFNRSVAGRSIEDYYLLRKGEFAYNRSLMNGYPFGAIKRLDRYDEGALSTLYLCFALNREDCDSDFLVHFFESGLLNRQLRGIAQMGARAHGLLNVTASDFFGRSMPLPTLAEQKRIATALNALDRQVELLSRQLDILKQQKKGVMQKLLTGVVRVKV